jgi:hypothetical protein
MNKITNFENNIYRQEKLDIYFLMFLSLIFPKINEISLKFYLVIRISNLKNFDAFMDSGLN